MDTPITRAEHEEFRRSMELANKNLADENVRQNARIKVLEEMSRQNMAIISNVERLAVNMENILKEQESIRKEQENQGNRLSELESRDGKSWRDFKAKVIGILVSALGGAMLGALAAMIFK